MYRSRFLGSPKNLDVLYTGTIYLLTLYNILKTISSTIITMFLFKDKIDNVSRGSTSLLTEETS